VTWIERYQHGSQHDWWRCCQSRAQSLRRCPRRRRFRQSCCCCCCYCCFRLRHRRSRRHCLRRPPQRLRQRQRLPPCLRLQPQSRLCWLLQLSSSQSSKSDYRRAFESQQQSQLPPQPLAVRWLRQLSSPQSALYPAPPQQRPPCRPCRRPCPCHLRCSHRAHQMQQPQRLRKCSCWEQTETARLPRSRECWYSRRERRRKW